MSKISYMINAELSHHFFSDSLRKSVNNLSLALAGRGELNVFTDAMVKKNGIPNGLAMTMPYHETILFPFLLRDPGCGFLMFKLSGIDQKKPDWKKMLGSALNDFVNQTLLNGKIKASILSDLVIEDILFEGLLSIKNMVENKDHFRDLKFDVDTEAVQLSEQESLLLRQDLLSMTNTLEIRQVDSVANIVFAKNNDVNIGDLIGFIHAGCNLFPDILGRKFNYAIAEYVYQNQLFSLDQIEQASFGVSINCSLGYEYYQWLKAAMNYALVNRYLLYQAIKEFLQQQFACEIVLINDVLHAGIFSNGIKSTVATRGVQLMSRHTQSSMPSSLRLVAGQKESIALLVSAGSQAGKYGYLIQHGASYEIADSVLYNGYFEKQEIDNYHYAASHAYYNTEYDIKNCIPYAFNTMVTQDYLEKTGLVECVAVLTPAINIHGKALMQTKEVQNMPK